MIYLTITVLLTIGISAFCSALEAMILSTTPVDIESLKKTSPRKGNLLESMVQNMDETSSAILGLNTIANTFGATLAGAQFAFLFGSDMLTKYIFPASITVSILIFAEILPKNFGVLYRKTLHIYLIYPLYWIKIFMWPIAFTSSFIISRLTDKKNTHETSDDEIILLAQKGEKDGLLTSQERDLIANSLSLDDVTIAEIMTPRTVVASLDQSMSIGEVFKENPDLRFSRFPVYKDTVDKVYGLVRRRDILTAMANDNDSQTIADLATPATFVPENGSALSILRQLLKKHQQMGIVVDEFASLTGVITLEDIFEHLLGSEIFESDDMAVDMRELARKRSKDKAKN